MKKMKVLALAAVVAMAGSTHQSDAFVGADFLGWACIATAPAVAVSVVDNTVVPVVKGVADYTVLPLWNGLSWTGSRIIKSPYAMPRAVYNLLKSQPAAKQVVVDPAVEYCKNARFIPAFAQEGCQAVYNATSWRQYLAAVKTAVVDGVQAHPVVAAVPVAAIAAFGGYKAYQKWAPKGSFTALKAKLTGDAVTA